MLMVDNIQTARATNGYGRDAARMGGGAAATVQAVFADNCALLLRLRDNATLGDLASELADCGRRHGGAPLYVRVTFRS